MEWNSNITASMKKIRTENTNNLNSSRGARLEEKSKERLELGKKIKMKL